MGRVRKYVKVNGMDCWTLFDSGAENTYVVRQVAGRLERTRLPTAKKIRLGGTVHEVIEICTLDATVSDKPIKVAGAYVVDHIGRDERAMRDFDILLGARALQDWGIELLVGQEDIDVSRYPGEFVEF